MKRIVLAAICFAIILTVAGCRNKTEPTPQAPAAKSASRNVPAETKQSASSTVSTETSLDEAFAYIRDGEMYLIDCNISPYPMAGYAQHKPTRERKLLLHRREIRKWEAKVTLRGLTIVPTAMYFNEKGKAKVALALARGKTHADKRATLKKRADQRDMDRELRRRR